MNSKVKLVVIDNDYCLYLRNFDFRVYSNYDINNNRPYVGVLFKVHNMEYFAPLSSPKKKHFNMQNNIDFEKVEVISNDKSKELIGVINFNNMIPLKPNNYKIIDLKQEYCEINQSKYLKLLHLDFVYISNNFAKLSKKAQNLYKLYENNHLPEKLKYRCCDFHLLEEKCQEYNDKILIKN